MTLPWLIRGMKRLTSTRSVFLDAFNGRQQQLMLKQKYHGVQARGENVEEVLRAHAKQSNGVSVHLLYCELAQKAHRVLAARSRMDRSRSKSTMISKPRKATQKH